MMENFVHLHVHSEYSFFNSQCSITALVSKAHADGMPALAITDRCTMAGIPEFYNLLKKKNKEWAEKNELMIKPIFGCEMNVAHKSIAEKKGRDNYGGWSLILLAKNKQGYLNLMKLNSIANTEGFYHTPKVDHNLLKQFHEGLICCSSGMSGEIGYYFKKNDLVAAEEAIRFYKSVFGSNFYLELTRNSHSHIGPLISFAPSEPSLQDRYNEFLLEMSTKYGIKCVCTNDVHFVDSKDYDTLNQLVQLGGGGYRYSSLGWFKTTLEMNSLFEDIPSAISNTFEIAEKVEEYDITTPIELPHFDIPLWFISQEADHGSNFNIEFEYLSYLVFSGAVRRYKTLSDIDFEDVKNTHGFRELIKSRDAALYERIKEELDVIKHNKTERYFLIINDIVKAARSNNIYVGPGRGSVAGSIVAYCLGITTIDPLRFGLCYERFMHLLSTTLPDIDVDFDDGRYLLVEFLKKKYGEGHVAIIGAFGYVSHDSQDGKVQKAVKQIPDLVKRPGVIQPHASGVAIGKGLISDYCPLTRYDDKSLHLILTQYDDHYVESVGLMKLDFLGLRTLNIMKDTIFEISKKYEIELDIDNIPLDNASTFKLFQQGHTTAVYGFETQEMQHYLKYLNPKCFEDLVALYALQRCEQSDLTLEFIARKNGLSPVPQLYPSLRNNLGETYGLTIYEEQVMSIVQEIAGLSKEYSDGLRRAITHKRTDLTTQMREYFITAGYKNGYSQVFLSSLWEEWTNSYWLYCKSHAVCYTKVAYQTAYLKAHYPNEYMRSCLKWATSESDYNEIKAECRKMGIFI